MVQLKQRPSAADVAPMTLPTVLKRQPKRRIATVVLAGIALVVAGVAIVRVGPWSGRGRDVSPYVVDATKGSLAGVITASGELGKASLDRLYASLVAAGDTQKNPEQGSPDSNPEQLDLL